MLTLFMSNGYLKCIEKRRAILTCCVSQIIGLLWGLTACSIYHEPALPAGFTRSIEATPDSPIVEKQTISVESDHFETAPPSDYVIGMNDSLYINVYGHPELSSVLIMQGKMLGSRVDGSGNIYLPVVGKIPLAGLTVAQAESKLMEIYRPFIKDPWIVVEITDYKSQPVYLTGQFKNPGVVYLDRPINLLQGIALGAGLDANADLRGARLIRNNKIVTVDIYNLLREGAITQNIWLRAGDIIYIPDNKLQNVFVLGAVKKPGPVPIPHNQLSLLQAIAAAGGYNDSGYQEKRVRIIRSLSTTRGELLVVDTDKMLRGEALPFIMQEGDIVYVPRDAFGDWSQAVKDMLPTLELIGAILNPFVQIKFLSQ